MREAKFGKVKKKQTDCREIAIIDSKLIALSLKNFIGS